MKDGNRGGSDRRVGVVIVGHGMPPKDLPPSKLRQFRALAARIASYGGEKKAPPELVKRYKALEREIRRHKRTPDNDPYDFAVKELATEVRRIGGFDIVVVAHNEMCGLDVDEAIEEAIRLGANTVVVVPTMITKGGTHSEQDIPEKIRRARRFHPQVRIIYAWPFDTREVARLFVNHIRRYLPR